jgi:large subunit ribosomal protein L18
MHRLIRERRKAALTNYKRRVALLKGGQPRVVVRKTNTGLIMQVITYDPKGDKVLAAAHSFELGKFNWPAHKNMPTAYLTGLLLARKAKSIAKDEMVLDIGLYKPVKSSLIFAAAKGSIDGGLKIKADIKVDETRIRGEHIAKYAGSLKGDALKKQFSTYTSKNIDLANIGKLFDDAKSKIMNA